MFNLFKKKAELKLEESEKFFIEAIINKLSDKYPLFKKEIELETFVGIGKNPGGSKGSFTYFINNDSWKKICDPSIDNFFIKNLKFNSYNGERVSVDLFTSEGLIIGYKASVTVNEISIPTIDISEIWEKHFLNEEYTEIENVIGKLPKDQIRKLSLVKNTFKIQIDGSSYFPIHDIDDGNYIAIDRNGSVYKITHDPFRANRIYDSITEFIHKELS